MYINLSQVCRIYQSDINKLFSVILFLLPKYTSTMCWNCHETTAHATILPVIEHHGLYQESICNITPRS